jgi:hypothetical protein
MKRTQAEKRALHAITLARMMVPNYARGEPPSGVEIDQLLAFGHVKLVRANLDTPAVLTPPFGGWRRLVIAQWLPRTAAKYIELHECGHSLAGDADEPTFLQFSGPLPEAEEVADLFALAGIVSADDCAEGSFHVEQRIRELVPLNDRGWRLHRIPRLAPQIVRFRTLIDEWLD